MALLVGSWTKSTQFVPPARVEAIWTLYVAPGCALLQTISPVRRNSRMAVFVGPDIRKNRAPCANATRGAVTANPVETAIATGKNERAKNPGTFIVFFVYSVFHPLQKNCAV